VNHCFTQSFFKSRVFVLIEPDRFYNHDRFIWSYTLYPLICPRGHRALQHQFRADFIADGIRPGCGFRNQRSGLFPRLGKYKVLIIIGMKARFWALSLFTQNRCQYDQSGPLMEDGSFRNWNGIGLPIFINDSTKAPLERKIRRGHGRIPAFPHIGGTVSTAALGGIVNSQCHSRCWISRASPFVPRWNISVSSTAAAFSQINVIRFNPFLALKTNLN